MRKQQALISTSVTIGILLTIYIVHSFILP